ncbi:MAG TPA: cell division protein ZapA [Thermoanaerobaculia bacterium]|jgi:cell division protein ZapA (FtsZ GTPase activity inhibitor)
MSEATPGTTRVTILDEPFAIRSEADAEYTRRVAGHVDRSLREFRDKAPSMEPFQAAVLGAMEITDELFRLRERLATLEGEVAARIAELAAAIGETLKRTEGSSAATKGKGTAAR